MKIRTEIQGKNSIRKKTGSQVKFENSAADLLKINRITETIASEGNESFKNYLEWLGLAGDPKLVVLSSIHHYYYDAEEMANVSTVVNLKELNHIRDINNFLNSMFLILPHKCFLIGCFIDNKEQNGLSFRKNRSDFNSQKKAEAVQNGIDSRIPFLSTIFSILDLKTNKYLTSKNVSRMLRNNGFSIVDMTELDGFTYFCAQSQRSVRN